MGFIRGNALPFLKEHKRRPFYGRLLCLGRVDVNFSWGNWLEMAEVTETPIQTDIEVGLSHKKNLAERGFVSEKTLFRSLGFEQVEALDYSDFEGAEYVFDLNGVETPANLCNQFDCVIDHGTLEHVFYTPRALNHIFNILKIKGRIFHSSPASHYMDHGFYGFSPTLFYDFYTANQWQVNTIQVCQHFPNGEHNIPPFYADYKPGWFDYMGYGRGGDHLYATICVATKLPQSTGNAIPQQSFYTKKADWKPKS